MPSSGASPLQLLVALLSQSWIMAISVFVTACVFMLALGNPTIARIKKLRGMKWSAREDTPDSHLKKAGTPSMGGIAIIGAAVLAFVCFVITDEMVVAFSNRGFVSFNAEDLYFLAVLVSTTIGFMSLGFADDWSKARGKGGLRARDKFAGQVVLFSVFFTALFGWILLHGNFPSTELWEMSILVGVWLLILLGTCNAVNLTDGLDGLASGTMIPAAAVLFLCRPYGSYGQFGVGLFALAIAGACLGFLAFNRFPARVFMGDTGSLALGAALGLVAVLSGAVFLLPFIGFIFYVEMFSVIFQVAWFKYTRKKYGEGRRLLRRAPLHHHFELLGWSEWRVVVTFWLINLMTSLIGLVLWQMKIIPRWP